MKCCDGYCPRNEPVVALYNMTQVKGAVIPVCDWHRTNVFVGWSGTITEIPVKS